MGSTLRDTLFPVPQSSASQRTNHDNGGNSSPVLYPTSDSPSVSRQLSPAQSPKASFVDQHSTSLPSDNTAQDFTIEEIEENDPLLATSEARLPDEYEEPPPPQSQDSDGPLESFIAPGRPATLEDQMLDLSFQPSGSDFPSKSEMPVVGLPNPRKRAFSETFTESDTSSDVHMGDTDIPDSAFTPSKKKRPSRG